MTMHFPPLYILRHGQTEWNVERRLQGQRDSPLTELGKTQAMAQGRLLGQLMDEIGFDRLYCSPLGRARDTAHIAARDMKLKHIEDARLQEVSAGEWEGMTRPDLFAQLGVTDQENAEFDLFLNAPGGERYAELYARCLSFLQDMTEPSVVVTHGVTSTVLRGIALNLEIEDIKILPRGQGCIYKVADRQETCLREAGE